jgi:hypothetical protein
MSLAPVQYTKNWKDVAGSQYAAEDTAAKIALPVVMDGNAALPAVQLTVSHANGVTVDWGDGTFLPSAGGVISHQYTRNGNYIIRVTAIGLPDCYVDVVKRVTTIDVTPDPQSLSVVVAGLKATFTIANAIFPIEAAFGDLEFDRYWESPIVYTYGAPGTYIARFRDVTGWFGNVTVIVSAAVQFIVTPGMLAALHSHAQLNNFVEEHDLEVISAWFQMTVAEKKAWLLEKYGEEN